MLALVCNSVEWRLQWQRQYDRRPLLPVHELLLRCELLLSLLPLLLQHRRRTRLRLIAQRKPMPQLPARFDHFTALPRVMPFSVRPMYMMICSATTMWIFPMLNF